MMLMENFYLGLDSIIFYLGPGESEPWYVNTNPAISRRSVEAYERYGLQVVITEAERATQNGC